MANALVQAMVLAERMKNEERVGAHEERVGALEQTSGHINGGARYERSVLVLASLFSRW